MFIGVLMEKMGIESLRLAMCTCSGPALVGSRALLPEAATLTLHDDIIIVTNK